MGRTFVSGPLWLACLAGRRRHRSSRYASAAKSGKELSCIRSCCKPASMNCGRGSTQGGLRECMVRGLLYVRSAQGGADERGLAAIRRLRNVQDDGPRLTLAEFKALVRDQYYMLLIDQTATLAAIPDLIPGDLTHAATRLSRYARCWTRPEVPPAKLRSRLLRVGRMFGIEVEQSAVPTLQGRSSRGAQARRRPS